MTAPFPYRFFPDLNDLRRVGLLFGMPDTAAAVLGPKRFDISAAADNTPKPQQVRRNDRRRNGEINEVQFGVDAMRHDYICGKPLTNEAFDVFVIPRDFVRLPALANSPHSKRIAVAPVALVQVRTTRSSKNM